MAELTWSKLSRKLEGKTAIITGASRGIGKATAVLFAREGSNVVIADILEKEGKETEEIINKEAEGVKARFIRTDVSKAEEVKRMVKETVKEFGGVDILVNNAGIVIKGTIEETSIEAWDKVINVNLKSVFLCCKYVVPHMIRRGGGAIVNVASYIGLMGGKEVIAYVASKAGVIGLTKALALDLAPYNIRVNAVAPRTIDTILYRQYRSSEEIKERVKTIPLRRLGKPEEVAKAILFLASDDASYIFGEVILIGGVY